MARQRPSEIITALRQKSELAKEKAIIKGVGKNARYCPAGHCFAHTLLLQRQRCLQEAQALSYLPPIACDGCAEDIEEEYIAGCCKVCDIDFCEHCFESGRPIDELLQEGLESEIGELGDIGMSIMSSTAGEMPMTMRPTNEYCGAGHQLGRVSSLMRRRHLQERDGLSGPPTIECDCCSKQITNHTLCCLECDIDFCEDCFQSGQSFETFFEDMQEGDDDDDADLLDKQKKESRNARRRQKQLSGRQRYDGRRPTYKGTGRVSYDEFPDPTAFQWTFTGSCESTCVEFFEKDYAKRGVVKLDFYYTEGTVSTVLEHRRNGETALLGKKSELKPKTYRKILLHPQKCTDERYKKNRRKLVV